MKTLIISMSTLGILFGAGAASAAGLQYSNEIPADVFVKADRNHDGKLNAGELERAKVMIGWKATDGSNDSGVSS